MQPLLRVKIKTIYKPINNKIIKLKILKAEDQGQGQDNNNKDRTMVFISKNLKYPEQFSQFYYLCIYVLYFKFANDYFKIAGFDSRSMGTT